MNEQAIPNQQVAKKAAAPSLPLLSSHIFIMVVVGLVMLGIGFGTGYLIFADKTPQIHSENVQKATLISPTSLPTPTASSKQEIMKTYTNNYYNYSLQYPDTWETYGYDETPQGKQNDAITERFWKPVGDTSAEITFVVFQTSGATLQQEENSFKAYPLDNKKISEVQVDGVKATKVSGSDKGKEYVSYVFQKGTNIFTIQSFGGYASILNEMMSSFKFIN
jgi:hypothetical protein